MTIKILCLPLGPLQTNCYVLACTATGQAAVIDPAWDGRTIAKAVENQGWVLSHILLTHAHFDHVGGLGELKEISGAPIYIHPEALPMLERAPTAAAMWGFAVEPPPPADVLLTGHETLQIGEITVSVLFTPGHAPGHVCFYVANEDVVFDGDVLFQNSIGRTDLPGGDYDLLMQSIYQQLMPLPDDTLVLSGHGPTTTIGDERQNNPFLTQGTARSSSKGA